MIHGDESRRALVAGPGHEAQSGRAVKGTVTATNHADDFTAATTEGESERKSLGDDEENEQEHARRWPRGNER